MRHAVTSLISTIAASLLVGSAALLPAPAGAATDIVIDPPSIARGPDIAVPHLVGTTIVDGTTRVRLPGHNAQLYGTWHGSYVAATGNAQWANVRLWLVPPEGTPRLLRSGITPFDAVLAGNRIAYSLGAPTVSRPSIGVYDLALGREVAAHAFPAQPTILDLRGSKVVVTVGPPKARTLTWDTSADLVSRVVGKRGDYAVVAHDLVGYFDKDPFRGGCQVLARLSEPTDVLWRSCDERIEAVSPDARRMATIPLLSDGIGTADVVLRTIAGRELVHYSIVGHFGQIRWETSTKLLLESFGRTKTATVRCKAVLCDRATRLVATPPGRGR